MKQFNFLTFCCHLIFILCIHDPIIKPIWPVLSEPFITAEKTKNAGVECTALGKPCSFGQECCSTRCQPKSQGKPGKKTTGKCVAEGKEDDPAPKDCPPGFKEFNKKLPDTMRENYSIIFRNYDADECREICQESKGCYSYQYSADMHWYSKKDEENGCWVFYKPKGMKVPSRTGPKVHQKSEVACEKLDSGIHTGSLLLGKDKKCGTNYNTICISPLQCQGYMGTSAKVMSGYCEKEKKLGEVCGEMSAGKPNENHFTFVGRCSPELRCTQNKCVEEDETTTDETTAAPTDASTAAPTDEPTAAPTDAPTTPTDFAEALSGCWMKENPNKLHDKWEIWEYGKLWELWNMENITFPTLINSMIDISATVDDNQTMNVTISVKFITNTTEVYGYTMWGKSDNETIGTLEQWKQMQIGKAMNKFPVAFDFEDSILRTYGIMTNSTAHAEYQKLMRWSIDPGNPKRLMKEKWFHNQSNTNGTFYYIKYDCENDTTN